jgi:hypothetical protein
VEGLCWVRCSGGDGGWRVGTAAHFYLVMVWCTYTSLRFWLLETLVMFIDCKGGRIGYFWRWRGGCGAVGRKGKRKAPSPPLLTTHTRTKLYLPGM